MPLLLLTCPALASASPTAPYIVMYDQTGADRVAADEVADETTMRERRLGFTAGHRFTTALRGFAARLSPGDAGRLRADPEVRAVTRDNPVSIRAPVPIAAGEQVPTGISRIRAVQSGIGFERSNVGVAVIDTGVSLDHPDLEVAAGANCVGSGPPADGNGHGTMVAGVVGAKNNGAGVVGVAPGTTIHAVKVLNSLGTGRVSNIICGVEWVTRNATRLGIRIANMSIGGPGAGGPCEVNPLHFAICTSTKAGVLYTVAAGNDSRDFGASPPDEPAVFPEVLAVTAMSDSDGAPGGAGGSPACLRGEVDDFAASFSNYGSSSHAFHTIAAPGVCIKSVSLNGTELTDSGTSLAAPHAAGVAALCLGQAGVAGSCSGLTPAQMIDKLRRDAAEAATTANGFFGDPLHPLHGHFGFLVSAERSAAPPPPPPAPLAPAPAGGTSRQPSKPAQRRCRVPRVRGLRPRVARKRLRRAGCRYRFRGRGRVRSTVPRAGRRTARRVVVRLRRSLT